MVDALHDGAAHAECDVDVTVEKLFTGYRLKPSEPAVLAAEAALRECGYEPTRIATGGGSDANAFVAAGLPVVNLANGTERNHQPDERVSVAALDGDARRDLRPARRGRRADERRLRAHRHPGRSSRGASSPSARTASATRTAARPTARSSGHNGAVGVVAHDDEHVYLVRQPREAVGAPDLLELPAGKLDEEGEPPLETAKRELAEEIGKAAEHWELLHVFYPSVGFSDEQVHVYLATGLSDVEQPETEEDERIEHRRLAAGRPPGRDRRVPGLQDAHRAPRAPRARI